jgi:hypothetical protein
MTENNILILGVCILLRAWDPGDGFIPSTQRHYRTFLLFNTTYCYMFLSYDNLQAEIY